MKLSPSTASNRYQSAFRYIVGHDYTPELWAKIFVPLKLNHLTLPKRSGHRPWRSRSYKAIPASTVAPPKPGKSESGFLNLVGVGNAEFDQIELVLDVQTLIKMKRSNTEILAELELRPEFGEYIDYLRKRDDCTPNPSNR